MKTKGNDIGVSWAELQHACRELPIYQYKKDIIEALTKNDTLILAGETGSGKSTQIPKYILQEGLPKWRQQGTPQGRSSEAQSLGISSEAQLIGITQPRRLAAVTLAKRVASEMGDVVGRQVGYSVRFDEKVTPNVTQIKYLTDGMLLRELLIDPQLEKYCVICLDEVHERSLRTDILFGLLKLLQMKRKQNGKPLKLVVMSATMEIEKFVAFFTAPLTDSPESCSPCSVSVLQVEGRQYPVRIFYTKDAQKDYLESAALTIFQIHMNTTCRPWPGVASQVDTAYDEVSDILVFLSGQEEIEKVTNLLKKDEVALYKQLENGVCQYGKLQVLPLYASLPAEQQLLIFEQTRKGIAGTSISEEAQRKFCKGFRRVILTTNVAETSITVPNIRYVVDTGMMKERHFHANLSLDSLLVTPVSQASARQRSGRAGRHAAGYCYRLYREQDFLELNKASVPEIARTELTYLVLYLKSLGVDNILAFPYIDRPHVDRLRLALQQLLGLGALDQDGNITALGKTMALFPLEPRLSRMIVLSQKHQATDEIVTMLAFLSVENLFVHQVKNIYPSDEMDASETNALTPIVNTNPWQDPTGDHMSLIRLYDVAMQLGIENFLSQYGGIAIHRRAFREAIQVRKQLLHYCKQNNIQLVSCQRHTDNVLACLTEAYRSSLSNIAVLQGTTYVPLHQVSTSSDKQESDLTKHFKLKIHPTSSLFGESSQKGYKMADMLIFHELIFTSQCYMKCISRVDPSLLIK